MSDHPVSLPAPGYTPSFHCAVEHNLLDQSAIDEVNAKVRDAQRQHLIGPGADQFMARVDIKGMKGIGERLGNVLSSRAFSIHTIGDLANYKYDFSQGIEPLKASDIELLNTLRAALNACKNPPASSSVGHKVTVTENDPRMSAELTPGREVVQYGKGQDGYAELTLRGDPSDNGFVASFLSLAFSAFGVRDRGHGIVEFPGFKVSVLASESTTATAKRLQSALEDHGLAMSFKAIPDARPGIPQHQVQIRIWEPRVL